MIINKHSKLILMVAIALTINQKIYSAEQQEVLQPDTDSANETRSATYTLIPDYGKNINSTVVADLNRRLQDYGYYELAPDTYGDITELARQDLIPVDLSFSKESLKAIITWNKNTAIVTSNKKGFFSCFSGRKEKTVFGTIPIEAVSVTPNKKGVSSCLSGRERKIIFETVPIDAVAQLNVRPIPKKRPSTTPLVQPYSAHDSAHYLACLQTEKSIFDESKADLNRRLHEAGDPILSLETYQDIQGDIKNYGMPGILSFNKAKKYVTCRWKKEKEYSTAAYTESTGCPPNINSKAVAYLNRLLKAHGDYEFPLATYVNITRQTEKFGVPTNLSFSRLNQKATVTWKRERKYYTENDIVK
jgi:hypothetical protein